MSEISMDKKYRTKSGNVADILCIDPALNKDFPVLATLLGDDGIKRLRFYTIEGKFMKNEDCDSDLVEVTKYDHIKDGDLVFVTDDVTYGPHTNWSLMRFAGVRDGKVMTYSIVGTTSWKYCIKAGEGDLP